MAKPRQDPPSSIEAHAEISDRLAALHARERAEARGAAPEQIERSVARAVRQAQRAPVVTADVVDDPRAFARFWARIYIDRRYWRVEGTLARSGYGVVVIDSITIRPWDEPGPEPTTVVLRVLPVTELRRRALAELRSRADFVERMVEVEGQVGRTVLTSSPAEREAILRGGDLAGPEKPQRGRKGGGIDFYRGVARDAVRIAATGSPVYQTLADERGATVDRVRHWIADARSKHQTLVDAPGVWRLGPRYEPEAKEDE